MQSILHIISFEKYQHFADQLSHYLKIWSSPSEIYQLNVAEDLEENKERAQWSEIYDIHYLLP